MKKLTTFLVLSLALLASSCSGGAEKIDTANYLAPNTKVLSPDGQVATWTVREGVGDDSEVVLYAQGKSSAPVRLCANIRTFGVLWSPDSRFLAVADNFAAGESQTLVFDMGLNGFPLVYETPVVNDSFGSWSVKSWQPDKRAVTLVDAVGKKTIQVKLPEKRIKRTEY